MDSCVSVSVKSKNIYTMDGWVNDESLFISRKLGLPQGVVQVYRCWSLDTPLGEDSFSLMGETSSPSEIAPATVWGQRNYLRLIEFLEVNSTMFNIRGHVILRSQVKSRRVGRADGPETYWRCLDVVPLHNIGLRRPVDTHGGPQFLITGGDVDTTTPGKVIVDDKLDAELKQVKFELATLKDTLGGVNETLTKSQTENKKLVREIEDQKSTNKQLEVHVRDIDGERQKATQEAENLKMKLSDCVSKSDLNDQLEKERNLWAAFAGYST